MNNFLSNSNERFKSGLNLASNSFSLLWHHPVLLVYLSISIGLYLIMQTISDNVSFDLNFTTGIINVGLLFDLSRWHHYILLFVFTFAYVYLSTFITICLLRHVNRLLRYKKVDLITNIKKNKKKLRITFYWSLIITSLAYLIQLISGQITTSRLLNPYMLFTSLFGIIWSLLTLIVVPIIALEKTTIIQALTKSKRIVISLFIEIISGELWIALVAFLSSMPFIIPLILKMNVNIPNILVLLATVSILLIALMISTIQGIFKTMIYVYYMQPLEELDQLRYPRF